MMGNVELSRIGALLSQIEVVARKNRESLSKSEWKFDVFDICGIDHYENANSRIIAEFLSPSGSHGLGSAFLERFFTVMDFPFRVSSMTEVLTELSTDEGRMDIVIRDRERDWCVVIENKIYAAEQSKQLQRYWKWLMSNYRADNSRLVFLTLSGYASGTADDEMRYSAASYSKHIVQWLDACIAIAAERPFVRETLRQYRNHIRGLSGMSLEEQNMNEVVKMMTKDADAFEAAQVVNENFSEACKQIATGIFVDVADALKGVCDVAPDAEAPDLNSKEDGFRMIELKTGVLIRIAPDRKGFADFFVGVPKGDAKEFASALRKGTDESWEKNAWWPCYKYLPDQFRWWTGDMLVRCMRDRVFRVQLVDAISYMVKELCVILRA